MSRGPASDAPPGAGDHGGPDDRSPAADEPAGLATAWPELAPLPRLAWIGGAWAVLIAGSPGVLSPDGHALGALGFAALWGPTAIRPGRRAWLVEWAVAAVALGVLMHWLRYISWAVVPPTGVGMGAYAMAGGVVARSAARWLPGALAAALGWTALETLRDLIEPPFGMGWLRLGHLVADLPTVAGTARLWGVAGLTFVLVLLACGLALGLAPRVRAPRRRLADLVSAGASAIALGAAGTFVPAPATEPGPTLLLVQPNIAQDRKLAGASDREIVAAQAELTRDALAAGPVDLVCWSETMLRATVVGEGARDAAAAGVGFDPWLSDADPLEVFAWLDEGERRLVLGDLLGVDGPRRLLPEGTAFLAGTEEFRALDGRLRRFNSGVLWSPTGARRAVSKRHLVPLGETLYGLERFEWGRKVVGGYIADLAHVRDEPALAFEDREGRTWRLGVPICFDNAFLDAFRDDVDLNVVLSNEAWYRDSIELDQMVAFTRLAAIASGRPVARCTNSGITSAFDVRGQELGRVTVDGADREVAGTLRVQLWVPSDPAYRTPFARFGTALRWGLVAAGLAAAAVGRLRRPA